MAKPGETVSEMPRRARPTGEGRRLVAVTAGTAGTAGTAAGRGPVVGRLVGLEDDQLALGHAPVAHQGVLGDRERALGALVCLLVHDTSITPHRQSGKGPRRHDSTASLSATARS